MTNKEWALYYLNKGFSVIPVGKSYRKKNKKEPFINEWREFQERFPTEEEINSWWNSWPNAKPAIICGKLSNLTVVDIDELDIFKKTGIRLQESPIVKTQRGFHYYYKYNEEFSKTIVLPFGEIRVKAYVIAPPAEHHSEEGEVDGEYTWSIGLEDVEMQVFDYSVFELIKKEVKESNSFVDIAKGVKYGEGRNNSAAVFIGGMLKKYPKHEWGTTVWDITRAWNLSVESGKDWSEEELMTVFNSICNAEASNNKTILKTEGIKINELMKKECDPKPFIIDGMIKKNSINMIHGDTGCGKSMLALKMIDDLTCGNKFLNKFDNEKIKCLLIDLEMTEDDCISRAKEICCEENDSVILYEKQWHVTDKNSIEWLTDIVKKNDIKVVVFDTFSKIHTDDENSNSQMTPVMAGLMELCNDLKITIIALHHINKSKEHQGLGKGRGATAIADNSGSYLSVSSKKLSDSYGNSYLSMKVNQLKSRRRESVNSFQICIKYDCESKKTNFEYMGEVEEDLDPINKARDEVYKLIGEEPGLYKSVISKRFEGVFNKDVIRNAIDSLLGEGKLILNKLSNKHMLYVNKNTILQKPFPEEIDTNKLDMTK